MIPIEAEGRKFGVDFKHEINFIEHPRPKKNKDGTTIDKFTKKPKVMAQGGKTICSLHLMRDDGAFDFTYEAVAKCSELDMYNRAIGREIAFGRAVKMFEQHLIEETTIELHGRFKELPHDMSKEEAKAARDEIIQEISRRVNEAKALRKAISKEFAKRKNKGGK